MGWYIGARDRIDRALVQQYADVQTTTFDHEKIDSDTILTMINMLSLQQKNFHIKNDLKQNTVSILQKQLS